MTDYTHWLVTRGRGPSSVEDRGLVPILLKPRTDDLSALRKAVHCEVERRTRLFLIQPTTPMETLQAATRPYVLTLLQDLWLRDVRLETAQAWRRRLTGVHFGGWDEDELFIRWTLLGPIFPPAWQGPADGVIPAETPVTVFSRKVPASSFRTISD